jgi:hypothetical protein
MHPLSRRTTKRTCRGGWRAVKPWKVDVPPWSGAAAGSALPFDNFDEASFIRILDRDVAVLQ